MQRAKETLPARWPRLDVKRNAPESMDSFASEFAVGVTVSRVSSLAEVSVERGI